MSFFRTSTRSSLESINCVRANRSVCIMESEIAPPSLGGLDASETNL